MNAGRELDALIAERIIGGYWSNLAAKMARNTGTIYNYPKYSTDLTAAFELVEHLRKQWDLGDNTCDFWTFKDCGPSGWRAEITFIPDHDGAVITGAATAGTLPHAICLAAGASYQIEGIENDSPDI